MLKENFRRLRPFQQILPVTVEVDEGGCDAEGGLPWCSLISAAPEGGSDAEGGLLHCR